jgi:uncharacterized protein (TIGR00297 family)
VGAGLVLSLAIGLAGYRLGALSRGGAVGAVLAGTLTAGLGGWLWGWLLVAFFVSSSLLSHYRSADKAAVRAQFAKGEQRDLGQVLANGGLGALLAVAVALTGREGLFAAYLGALAAVNADTWATEIGVLSRRAPRLITTGQPVPAGTSGGVTASGLMAALAGGSFIGLAAWAWVALLPGASPEPEAAWWPLWAAGGGLAGALFDSLLGATVQSIYFCDRCRKETERPVHRCGARARRLRGWTWLNNDGVNFLSSLVGGLVTMELATWW